MISLLKVIDFTSNYLSVEDTRHALFLRQYQFMAGVGKRSMLKGGIYLAFIEYGCINFTMITFRKLQIDILKYEFLKNITAIHFMLSTIKTVC